MKAPERRRLILDAAREVFARTSLQGASTREIARAASVNQATLFEHFTSKDELFSEAVVVPLLDALREMCDSSPYDDTMQETQISKTMNDLTKRHLNIMIEIFPMLVSALFSDEQQGKRIYLEHISKLMHPRGTLDPLVRNDLDAEFVGLAMFGVLFAVAMNERFCGPSPDVTALSRKITTFGMLGFLQDSYRR
jgi:AcrR family transcriptional regulator